MLKFFESPGIELYQSRIDLDESIALFSYKEYAMLNRLLSKWNMEQRKQSDTQSIVSLAMHCSRRMSNFHLNGFC